MLLNACATNNYTNLNKSNKLTASLNILPTMSLINPALGFTSLIASSSTIQKVYATADLVYMTGANNGETIAETLMSNTTNKKCRLVNVIENNNICF